MHIPTEVADIKIKASQEATQVANEVEHYESDLITFVCAHKLLALQFAIIVCTPVMILAFQVGKHWPQ